MPASTFLEPTPPPSPIGTFAPVDEWKEARAAIGRFDATLADLRKYGFSLITTLITGSAVLNVVVSTASGSASLSAASKAAATTAILLLIAALFLLDRYYSVLQSSAVERALDTERQFPHRRAIEYLTEYVSHNASTSRVAYAILLVYLGLEATGAALGFAALGRSAIETAVAKCGELASGLIAAFSPAASSAAVPDALPFILTAVAGLLLAIGIRLILGGRAFDVTRMRRRAVLTESPSPYVGRGRAVPLKWKPILLIVLWLVGAAYVVGCGVYVLFLADPSALGRRLVLLLIPITVTVAAVDVHEHVTDDGVEPKMRWFAFEMGVAYFTTLVFGSGSMMIWDAVDGPDRLPPPILSGTLLCILVALCLVGTLGFFVFTELQARTGATQDRKYFVTQAKAQERARTLQERAVAHVKGVWAFTHSMKTGVGCVSISGTL